MLRAVGAHRVTSRRPAPQKRLPDRLLPPIPRPKTLDSNYRAEHDWDAALFHPQGSNVMPVHDWTRVSDGTFHDFHYSWVLEIKRALKRGLLPKGYYVMAEESGGDLGALDVLTLQAAGSYARVQPTLVIRHSSNDRIVAIIEVLSPGSTSSR